MGCSTTKDPADRPKRIELPTPARILHFYVSPGEIGRGEQALLCYGVENARSVRLEPPVETLSPLQNHCFAVKPERTTEYRLLAEGFDQSAASEKLTLRVKAGAAAVAKAAGSQMIQVFTASATEIAPQQQVTLCYAVRDAVSVRVEPGGQSQYPPDKSCFTVKPAQTTTYMLTASAKGKTEQQRVTVKVR